MNSEIMSKYVPDESVIVNGFLRKLAESELGGSEIVLPNILIARFETQAKEGKDSGLVGLTELLRLRKLADEGWIRLSFAGGYLTPESNSVGAGIRQIAAETDSTLLTSDEIMADVARVEGLKAVSYTHLTLPTKRIV